MLISRPTDPVLITLEEVGPHLVSRSVVLRTRRSRSANTHGRLREDLSLAGNAKTHNCHIPRFSICNEFLPSSYVEALPFSYAVNLT
jgi:hypothetical protein